MTKNRVWATGIAIAATFGVCLGTGKPASAWWASGHAVIAMMAYRQMKPETRVAVDALLKQHPDYQNWQAEMPANITDAQRGEYAFAIASTWPDRIKDRKDTTVSTKFVNFGDKRNPPPQPLPSAPALYPDLDTHDSWHYLDIPINKDNKPRISPLEESILTALPTCEGHLGEAVLPGSYRAYYLSWLAHLVGDIHQPLHATGYFSAARPNGDQGGNAIHLINDGSQAQPKNLHAYWDSLLGAGPDPVRYNTLQNYWGELNKTIDTITAEAPRLLNGYDMATQMDPNPADWLRESFNVAQEVVYTFGDPDATADQPQPDATYRALATRIAHQRAALAARRLALACDAALAPGR